GREDLRPGGELDVDLEPDHRLPHLEHRREPAWLGHVRPPIPAGRRSPSPTVASMTAPARSSAASSSGRSRSCAPIGRPSPVRPHGTLMPGSPARLHDSVNTSPRYMSIGVALAPNANAGVGAVGVRITSQ